MPNWPWANQVGKSPNFVNFGPTRLEREGANRLWTDQSSPGASQLSEDFFEPSRLGVDQVPPLLVGPSRLFFLKPSQLVADQVLLWLGVYGSSWQSPPLKLLGQRSSRLLLGFVWMLSQLSHQCTAFQQTWFLAPSCFYSVESIFFSQSSRCGFVPQQDVQLSYIKMNVNFRVLQTYINRIIKYTLYL